MDTKKISQVMAVIKKVAKQSTKVVAAALPVATIVGNVLQVNKSFPGDPEAALENFLARYHGVSPSTKKFEWQWFMRGSGQMILAGVAGYIMNQLA